MRMTKLELIWGPNLYSFNHGKHNNLLRITIRTAYATLLWSAFL